MANSIEVDHEVNREALSVSDEGVVSGSILTGPITFRTQGEINRGEEPPKAFLEVDLTGYTLAQLGEIAAKGMRVPHRTAFRDHCKNGTGKHDVSPDKEAESFDYREQFATDEQGRPTVRVHADDIGSISAPMTKDRAQGQMRRVLAQLPEGEREALASEMDIDLADLDL